MTVEGANCVVTGGSGLCGRRLVEMLAEKGAARVVSFDISAKPADAMEHPAIDYQQVRRLYSTRLSNRLPERATEEMKHI